MYNDHLWDSTIVVDVVDRWSLFRGHLSNKFRMGPQNGGCCRQVDRYLEVVVDSGLTVLLLLKIII